jgi:AcrR family transcriptional regulator
VPIGRHSRPKDEIEAIQRVRIANAFVEEVARNGYEKARVTEVCVAAGVSTKTFYSIFTSKVQCYLDTFDTGAGVLYFVMKSAFKQAANPWEHRVGKALSAVLELLAANPAFARFCILEPVKVSAEAEDRFRAIITKFRRILGGVGQFRTLPEIHADVLRSSLVGCVLRPLIDYAECDKIDKFPELAPVITYFLVRPIVGEDRALRELWTPR